MNSKICRTGLRLIKVIKYIPKNLQEKQKNLHNTSEKLNFKLVFSNDIVILLDIIAKLDNVWNNKTAHGTMHTE